MLARIPVIFHSHGFVFAGPGWDCYDDDAQGFSARVAELEVRANCDA